MAVVEPLRRHDPPDGPAAQRDNVVRLVDFLGPISPELVLVDPDLAPRARALLPELPGTRFPTRARPTVAVSPPRAPADSGWRWLRGWHGVAAGCAVVVLAVAGLLARGGSGGESVAPPPAQPTTRPPAAKPAPTPTPAATPGARSTARPATSPITPPRFVWPARAGASGYRLALYRGGSQVFEEDVRSPALELSSSWSYGGRFHRLERGTYRWIVWPLFGQGAGARTGAPIVSAQYVV